MKVLVFGATSAIAEAVARRYASTGARLHLVARRADRLAAIADDLRVRGAADVTTTVADLDAIESAPAWVAQSIDTLGGLDVALVAHGVLPDEAACRASHAAFEAQFLTNARSPIALLAALAADPRVERGAVLAVISSVAGDRGRASNYAYGSAKAAVTAYSSGLDQALAKRGVAVLTVKPGFVDTPMTAAFRKGPLWATPARVAEGIERAIAKKRAVAYVPGFWWFVMAAIRAIPGALFRRLTL